MGVFKAEAVNAAFDKTCPELKSKYARYPMKHDRWLNFKEKSPDGEPTFVASETDQDLKEDYVCCTRRPMGKGYYLLLTKVGYVDLYSRLMSMGSGGCCCFGHRDKADAWDTTRRVCYNRTRASRPDDGAAAEQAVVHMEGTKLNPVHGLKM